MKQPLVLQYLLDHDLTQLEDEHGVNSRFSADGRKLALNYDQLSIRSGDKLAEECRGMVIQPINDLKSSKSRIVGASRLLAWPMDRFYNLGDPACAQIDWNDVDLRVYEKLDGTMIVAYWDPDDHRWHCGTRAVCEGDVPFQESSLVEAGLTFSELFFRSLIATREAEEGRDLAWKPTGIEQVVHLDKELTYVFELTTPINRVVVKYDEPRVCLLAARHTATGQEIPIEELRLQHVRRPRTWPIRSAEALKAFVDSMDPVELEGAVVCDSRFNRGKCKNAKWVLASRSKDNVMTSKRSALIAVVKGQADDVIPLISTEAADAIRELQRTILLWADRTDQTFVDFSSQAGSDRKSFALLVKASNEMPGVHFNLWDKRHASTRDWLEGNIDKLPSKTLDALLECLSKM